MHPALPEILQSGPVLLDGAWGTQLQLRGLAPGACPEAWNAARPEAVRAVAQAYVAAGSRVILSNTFGGNRFVLERHGLGARVAELNTAGVALSRAAAGEQAWVFASVGPSGLMLLTEEVTADALEQAFGEQCEALRRGGAQGLVLETFSDLEELAIALRAAKQTGLPVACSMAYISGKDLDRTLMGTTPEQQVAALAAADILGANCGPGLKPYIEVCRRFRAATDKPLWIKPNAGLPESRDGVMVYKETAEDFAAGLQAIVAQGATFVGGCCGTTPEFLHAASRRLA